MINCCPIGWRMLIAMPTGFEWWWCYFSLGRWSEKMVASQLFLLRGWVCAPPNPCAQIPASWPHTLVMPPCGHEAGFHRGNQYHPIILMPGVRFRGWYCAVLWEMVRLGMRTRGATLVRPDARDRPPEPDEQPLDFLWGKIWREEKNEKGGR